VLEALLIVALVILLVTIIYHGLMTRFLLVTSPAVKHTTKQ